MPDHMKWAAVPRIACVLATALTIPQLTAGAQSAPVVVRIVENARIERIEPATQAVRTMYRVDPSELWLTNVAVGPMGTAVAVLRSTRGVVADGRFARLPRNSLVVLDTTGRAVDVIEHDVRRFVWCGDDQRLAYIAGRYHEGEPGFRPESVVIRDIRANADRVINLPIRAVELWWAAFDSSVYFGANAPGDSLDVWRYHLPTNGLTQMPYRGLRFSPSGAYYLTHSSGRNTRPGWHLFERASGREVAIPDTSLGEIQEWAFGQGDQLLLVHRTIERRPWSGRGNRPRAVIGRVTSSQYVVFDVPSRWVVKRGSGTIERGVSASAGIVPVVQNGRVDAVRRPTP